MLWLYVPGMDTASTDTSMCLLGLRTAKQLQSCSPVHCASCISINLHEQLCHLLRLEVDTQVGTQLITEFINIQLP